MSPLHEAVQSIGKRILAIGKEPDISGHQAWLRLTECARSLDAVARSLPGQDRCAMVDIIIQTVAEIWLVTPDEIVGPRRWQSLVMARHAAIAITRSFTGLQMEVIGQRFGGRHHSAVAHSERAVRDALATDPAFVARYEQCIHRLLGPSTSKPVSQSTP